MISGFDRYFQIARCFRDEDLRADRQLEFTQVDLEMSFPRQEHVFAVVENFMESAFAAAGVRLPIPFPKMTYDEAMRRFGTDKPDLRLPGLTDVRTAFTDDALDTLAIDPALPVVALRIPSVGELSRKEREENHPLFDKQKGAKFIDDFKRLPKSFPEAAAKVRELVRAAEEDFVIVVAGDPAHPVKASDTKFAGRLSEREINVYAAAGNFRTELAKKYADRHRRVRSDRADALREADAQSGKRRRMAERGVSSHLDRGLSRCSSTTWPRQVGAGASSVHRAARGRHGESGQRSGQRARQLLRPGDERSGAGLGVDPDSSQGRAAADLPVAGNHDEEARARFGFFLDALEYGTPPHGGIALGLDRIVMLLAGAANLREVIAFPKTAKAIDLMADAPTTVTEQQLRELHLKVMTKS